MSDIDDKTAEIFKRGTLIRPEFLRRAGAPWKIAASQSCATAGNPPRRKDGHRDCVWTVVAIWDGPKGRAVVEANARGAYRVTFGERIKTFGKRSTFSHVARDQANDLAKYLSGMVPHTAKQLRNLGNFTSSAK